MIAENQLNPHRWVEAHADYLYTYAISRIYDEEQARDLVQDTFLAALEKVASFERKSSERTWLTAILRNKIIDVYRKKSSGLVTTYLHQAEQEQVDFFDTNDGHWNREHAPQAFGIDHHDPVINKEFNQILTKVYAKAYRCYGCRFLL